MGEHQEKGRRGSGDCGFKRGVEGDFGKHNISVNTIFIFVGKVTFTQRLDFEGESHVDI